MVRFNGFVVRFSLVQVSKIVNGSVWTLSNRTEPNRTVADCYPRPQLVYQKERSYMYVHCTYTYTYTYVYASSTYAVYIRTLFSFSLSVCLSVSVIHSYFFCSAMAAATSKLFSYGVTHSFLPPPAPSRSSSFLTPRSSSSAVSLPWSLPPPPPPPLLRKDLTRSSATFSPIHHRMDFSADKR